MSGPFDLVRSDWEEPGFTIAEHTGSPPVDWARVRNVTIHYPGSPHATDPAAATEAKLIAHLRASQRSYVASRGYSYGYNAVVWGSVSAEVRGEGFRCAANGGSSTNIPSFAIQIRAGGLTADARGASPEEILEVRRIVAWAEERAGRRLEILGHRDHKSTGCPGDAIYAQIQAGVFRPLPEHEGRFAMSYEQLDHIEEQRVIDTRGGDGRYKLRASTPSRVQLPASVSPAGAVAAVVNLTITEPAGPGFAAAWPEGDEIPLSSRINFAAGQTIANEITVGLDDEGGFQIASLVDTHVVIDLVGIHRP